MRIAARLLILSLAALSGTACVSPLTGAGRAPSQNEGSGKAGARPGVLNPRGVDFSQAPEKIAFGSCANQDAPMPIWKAILAAEPDLYLAMGDNVYAMGEGQTPIAEQYRKIDRIPEYREAREKIPFMATWDDGDYGTRDGGADAPTKTQARKEFLSYFRYVKDNIPLVRDGIYHAKMIGGQVTGKRRKRVQGPTLQVIMLDTRSFRSPLKSEERTVGEGEAQTKEKVYLPNEDKGATVLGEAQWDWLEERLKEPAQLHVIVSSIQLIASEHRFEKWANFPKERERFFNLLKKTGAKNVVVFSGDRHRGSIAKTEIKGWGTLYDVTSSALNRPWTDGPLETDASYTGPQYPKENFGLARIDWPHKKVTIELRDIDGKPVQSTDLKLR